ncbi:MAG: glycosyltransferase family 4 protein [Spirulinaceae cyanobacterium SM2_1_0]|nr:glycosyltransferase family 4 protein [Spirulinaceae cyanobacterium SM2_1_0]
MFNSLAQLSPIYLLCPNLFGFKGGIQVYSRFLLEALQDLSPQSERRVFLKYDRQVPDGIRRSPQTYFHCFGRWPRRVQSWLMFLSIVVWGLWQRPLLLIATHLNYGIACYALKLLTGCPYWLVVHGLEGWNLEAPWHCAALRAADRIIAVSHYTRDRLLIEQNLAPEQVTVLPNTFEPERFAIAPKPQSLLNRYGLRPDQPVILTVSRLGRSTAHQKGYRQVIQALPKIRQQLPDVHYLLVGKGDDAPAVQALVAALGLQANVTLAGFIADEELPAHYQLCDVLALPSCIEGFGIVYLEALASGKPVLAGDRDGAVDPLQQGKLGCLVDPGDVGAIADQLTQILQRTHPNLSLYQPEGLQREAIEQFGLTKFQKKLAQLLAPLGDHSVGRGAVVAPPRLQANGGLDS